MYIYRELEGQTILFFVYYETFKCDIFCIEFLKSFIFLLH